MRPRNEAAGLCQSGLQYGASWVYQHPSFKPRTMKGDWPDHLLGPYKDYYKNLKKEENKDS